MFSNPPIGPLSSRLGFSLLEIVLALSVIAFAIIGILGLFPAAMKTARESQNETRATLIAQQIFSDLKLAKGTNRWLTFVDSPPLVITNFSLSTESAPAYIAYDAGGSAVTNLSAAEFPNSFSNAIFLAEVSVRTNTGLSGLSRVQTTIETPAIAPSTNRSKYTFVTLMNFL